MLGLLFAQFIMGGLAVWAGSEAVLPAYIIGMVLAGTVGNDSQAQYSYLVATVIGSAVVPTMIANAFFMPSHLLSPTRLNEVAEALADGAT
jgi:hypothetical protein